MAAVPFCARVLDGREWFTLTPGSSPGQALALSHRGRGDLREGLVGCPALLSPGSGFPPPYRGYGGGPRGNDGVLCFSLGSRLRGNDGGLNRRLRRFSQMGYDAPLPFVPGFWVPACAGMTGECAGMTGECAGMTGECAGMTGECAGMTGECRGNDVGGLSEPRIALIFADFADALPVPFGPGCVV